MLSGIEEQGKLTEELREQILAAETMVAVEDLYRPYKPKRRTRATIAKEKGLEPLADMISLQMLKTPLTEEAEKFVDLLDFLLANGFPFGFQAEIYVFHSRY